MSKKDKPHVAIVFMKIEVYDLDGDKKTSGINLSPSEFSNLNIKPKQLIEIKGDNLDDCTAKLKRKLDDFKKV